MDLPDLATLLRAAVRGHLDGPGVREALREEVESLAATPAGFDLLLASLREAFGGARRLPRGLTTCLTHKEKA